MTHNLYESQTLLYHHVALRETAELLAQATPDSDLAERLIDNIDALDDAMSELKHTEAQRKLKGRGPVAELARKLGLSRHPRTNLLEGVPEQHQATPKTVHALLAEFLAQPLTRYAEGGYFYPRQENLKELPEDPKNLKGGVYTTFGRLVLCLSCRGHAPSHFLVSLPKDTTETVQTRVVTYVDAEKEWVDHDTTQVLSLSSLRAGLVELMRKHGYPEPEPVSCVQVLVEVKQVLTELEQTTHELTVDNHHFTLHHNEQGKADLVIKKGGVGVRWDALTPTKQNQLVENLLNTTF